MIANDATLEVIRTLIEKLFEHIHLGGSPHDGPYSGFARDDRPFTIDEVGYNEFYQDLLRTIFSIPEVEKTWTGDGIEELMRDLVSELATIRDTATTEASISPDFKQIARDLVAKYDVQFDLQECYVPVIGLALAEPLALGDVKFWPLDMKKSELSDKAGTDFFDNLSPQTCCIASTAVRAERRKAREILGAKLDERLSVLRYIGSLIAQNGPQTLIFESGEAMGGVSHSLVIDSSGRASRLTDRAYSSLPLVMNYDNLQHARHYGLGHFQSILSTEQRQPLEDVFLTAVCWFGDANQDLSPTHSFVKFYISIEILLKRKDEKASTTLPSRISMLLAWDDRQRRKRISRTTIRIIEERNTVFHSGKPEKETIEYLAHLSRRVAQSTLNEIRHQMQTNKFKTQDELIGWIMSKKH